MTDTQDMSRATCGPDEITHEQALADHRHDEATLLDETIRNLRHAIENGAASARAGAYNEPCPWCGVSAAAIKAAMRALEAIEYYNSWVSSERQLLESEMFLVHDALTLLKEQTNES